MVPGVERDAPSVLREQDEDSLLLPLGVLDPDDVGEEERLPAGQGSVHLRVIPFERALPVQSDESGDEARGERADSRELVLPRDFLRPMRRDVVAVLLFVLALEFRMRGQGRGDRGARAPFPRRVLRGPLDGAVVEEPAAQRGKEDGDAEMARGVFAVEGDLHRRFLTGSTRSFHRRGRGTRARRPGRTSRLPCS